ncbi:hypothetical protein DOY81_011658, partial [Sarcophaga bullata]
VERIHSNTDTFIETTINLEGKTISDVKKKRKKVDRPVATTVKSIEVEEPQYNDNHNHRIIDNTSDTEKQNYNYNSNYNAANTEDEEADSESIMRRASLGKLKKNDIIDFYEEFQFKLECIICNSIESTFASLCVHYKNQHNMRGFAMCCGLEVVNVITPDIVLGGDEDITPIVKSEPSDDTEILQDEIWRQSNPIR